VIRWLAGIGVAVAAFAVAVVVLKLANAAVQSLT
jgi:hypothetical protein